MQVLQIHNTYLEPGGEDGVVRRERELLEKRGNTVEQISFKNPERSGEQARDLLLANWNPQSARHVRAALASFEPDVVHVHNTWYQASPSAVSEARQHAPVVATLHNYRRVCLNAYLYRNEAPCTDCVGTLPWRGIARRCYRGSAASSVAIGAATFANRLGRTLDRSVDRFLVLSDFAADLAVQSGIDEKAIVRHDNFVPDPGPRTVEASDSDTVVAIGRLSPEKGFSQLVAAWAASPPPGLRLVIVGDGPERKHIEAIAGPSTEVVGRRTGAEVAELMISSRALVFPSRWFEGQPLVLLEALAAGLPIVASDQPPLREIVDGADQVVVENDSWAESLAGIVDDDWVKRASAAARQRYEERYTPDVAGDRIEAIYRSLVD